MGQNRYHHWGLSIWPICDQSAWLWAGHPTKPQVPLQISASHHTCQTQEHPWWLKTSNPTSNYWESALTRSAITYWYTTLLGSHNASISEWNPSSAQRQSTSLAQPPGPISPPTGHTPSVSAPSQPTIGLRMLTRLLPYNNPGLKESNTMPDNFPLHRSTRQQYRWTLNCYQSFSLYGLVLHSFAEWWRTPTQKTWGA